MTKDALPDPVIDLPRRIILSISSDIGIALAKAWRAQNCEVLGTYRTRSDGCVAIEQDGAHIIQCDLADEESVEIAVAKLAQFGSWDVLVVASGSQEPVGPFAAVDFNTWEDSIRVNSTAQLRAVHGLMPSRRRDSARGPVVVFFAGGGTNNATINYSAYTISKIALIKMCELLDAEIPDVRFTIIGPGWVKTKIHQSTLMSQEAAGANYQRTVEMLAGNDCIPMERVVAGCNWLLGAPREVIGGRNFSLAHDRLGDIELEAALRTDSDMYKLRRAGNDRIVGRGGRYVAPEELLASMLEHLPSVPTHHVPGTSEYDLLAKTARHLIFQLFGPGNRRPRRFGPFGEIVFPYKSMGAIDSLDLFGLDELIIFAFYWTNRNRYRRVADIGANIGLHSMLLGRSDYEVRSYEPDPMHVALLKHTLSANRVDSKVEIVETAVSDCAGTAEFVRVLGNTTGSHLAGAKPNPYGPLERFLVTLRPIAEIMTWADLVKIDAEGHERQILLSTRSEQWRATDAIIEVGGADTAEALYDHFGKLGLNMYAQRLGWAKVQSPRDLPTSYREGSLFISAKSAMPW